MLERDPKKRLGSGPDDANELVSHPFFAGFDWEALMRKETVATYIPESSIDKELEALIEGIEDEDEIKRQSIKQQEDDEDVITDE